MIGGAQNAVAIDRGDINDGRGLCAALPRIETGGPK
jgi:hypothetical protein